jgi:hypothetical protein
MAAVESAQKAEERRLRFDRQNPGSEPEPGEYMIPDVRTQVESEVARAQQSPRKLFQPGQPEGSRVVN